MNKPFNVVLAAFFAWSISIGSISYAQVETEPVRSGENIQQDTSTNNKKEVEVLSLEDVQRLSEEPITSHDTVYTKQN